MKCFTHLACCLALLAGLAIGPQARADEPYDDLEDHLLVTKSDQIRAAAELYRKGKAYYRQGKYEEARAQYEQAFRLSGSYDAAGNLGNVELKLGMYAEAARHLSFSLDHLPPSAEPEKRERAERRLRQGLSKALEHVGRVELAVRPAGATVLVDGQSVGTARSAKTLFLDPGSHTIEARHQGYHSHQRQIAIKPAAQQRVEIVLTADPAARASAPISGSDAADTPECTHPRG